MENKKKLIAGIVGGIVGLALIGAVAYLYVNLDNQRRENKAMQELAELDKKEMENEYQQFANQYSEMRMQISNDSIVAQLTAEQEKTERLLKELKETKTSDAREIARLKRELATVRAILRNYVIEIDSLNRLNKNLSEENSRIKGQYNEATRQIEGLNWRRPFAAHHCRVRLHGEDPHGARRGFAQRGGGERRGVLAASGKMRTEYQSL